MTSGDAPLTEQQIRDQIRDLAPFRHGIDLPYGLNTFLEDAPGQEHRDRLSVKRHRLPILLDACGGSLDGLSVLDVACNCGGWTVEAARSGAKRVLGFDVVDRYIEQANFVKTALSQDLPQIEFRKLRVEDLSSDVVGTFDVTLCFGILYHLQDPVSAMQKIAAVTDRILFVATRLYRPPSREVDESLWRMNIRMPKIEKHNTANIWVDKPSCQFEPTTRAVIELLRFLGFSQIANPPDNDGKPSGMFVAKR